jgi:ribonuclease P protein component
LDTTTRYTLNKTQRLKSRKAIDALFANGTAFSLFPFRVIYKLDKKEEGKPNLQCGFSVSAKRFKKAVDRNRIKRLTRECWRLQLKPLDEKLTEQLLQSNVFLIYMGNELPEYDELFKKVTAVIKRLIKIIDENSKAGI